MNEKISVIVPVYNSEKYLKSCIDSVLAQSFRDFELLLLNDGSKDGSLTICERYAVLDPRVRIYSHSNMGASKTRERGLTLSEGKYVAFIDSDDWIDVDYLLHLHNAAERYAADLVCCNFCDNDVDQAEITEDQFVTDSRYHIESFWKGMRYAHSLCGKLYRRDVLLEVKYPELQYAEDTYVVTQVLHNVPRTVLLSYVGYHYVNNVKSLTRAAKGIRRESDVLVLMEFMTTLCQERYPEFLTLCQQRWTILLFNLICAASSSEKTERRTAETLVRMHISKAGSKGYIDIKWKLLCVYLRAPTVITMLLGIYRKIKSCMSVAAQKYY
jgi:glycosyltransferase involved in cell wall biosynthesis